MKYFITIAECAELLGLERHTVARHVRSGRIPAVKIGKVYRVRRADLEGLFDQPKGETK